MTDSRSTTFDNISTVPSNMPKVLLFVDNSNIFISAKDEAFRREGRPARDQVRLQFGLLLQLALAGRPLANAFVVGSIPPEQRAVWEQLETATGVRPELYERGQFSGGEQGLDQCLQVHMLRAISDHRDPQIAILMTRRRSRVRQWRWLSRGHGADARGRLGRRGRQLGEVVPSDLA